MAGGPEALEDRSPWPSRICNRIPEPVREKAKNLALKERDLSPRELAVRVWRSACCFSGDPLRMKPEILLKIGRAFVGGVSWKSIG